MFPKPWKGGSGEGVVLHRVKKSQPSIANLTILVRDYIKKALPSSTIQRYIFKKQSSIVFLAGVPLMNKKWTVCPAGQSKTKNLKRKHTKRAILDLLHCYNVSDFVTVYAAHTAGLDIFFWWTAAFFDRQMINIHVRLFFILQQKTFGETEDEQAPAGVHVSAQQAYTNCFQSSSSCPLADE